MAVTPKRMSLAEFLKLPEVKPALELSSEQTGRSVRSARAMP